MRNKKTVGFYTFLLALSWFLPTSARGQNNGVELARVAAPPSLEEVVRRLGNGVDPGLEAFSRVTGFTQQTPTDGEPAVQDTDVYLGYDDQSFYAVFVAHDETPERIRARMAPRESVADDDHVTLMLDSDHDRRRAYAFRSNPRGVQWDALWTEGQGFDTSFDAVWTSRAALTGSGYVVLFEVPYKTLRFPASGVQTWGIVLSRSVPRGQGEVSYWPRVSSRVQGTLTQAGELRGISQVSSGRNLQAIPYLNARSFSALDLGAAGGPRFVSDHAEWDVGADLKAVLDDRFVLDATVNPDFSQVESDQPQVTVNQRFELFFPERRPFFTENADYFRTPISILFTRRIADPQWGGRFTGKTGPWSIGALVIDDQSPGKRAPQGSELDGKRSWFGVARVSRDLGDFSRFGAIYAQRGLAGETNRVGGADARVRLGDHWSLTGQLVGSGTTQSDEMERSGHAASASLARSGRLFTYFGNFTDISADFDSQAGFVPRTDLRRFNHFASYFFRPGNRLITWGPEVLLTRVWDRDGLLLDDVTEASLEWNFVGGSSIEINYRAATDRLRPQDHPALDATRSFDVGFWDFEYGTSYFDSFQLGGNLRIGNQINLNPIAGQEPSEADWFQLNLGLSLRPSTQLRIDNRVLWTTLDDPTSKDRIFTNRILRTRWNWQFTRELSVRGILQYEDTKSNPLRTSLETRKNLNGDLLLTYRVNPWTAAYVGINANGQNVQLVEEPGVDRRITRVDALRRDAHQFFLKLSYLLRK